MTGEQLFECLGKIDYELLECSEQKQTVKQFRWKWLAVAACAALVIAIGALFPFKVSEYSAGNIEESAIDEASHWVEARRPSKIQDEGSIFAYNILWRDDVVVVDVPSQLSKAELTQEEMDALLPENMPDWALCTGIAWVNEAGKAEAFNLKIATQVAGLQVDLIIGCPWNEHELQKSLDTVSPFRTICENTEYTLYYNGIYNVAPSWITLSAVTNSGGIERVFRISGPEMMIEQAQPNFEELLMVFAQWETEVSMVENLINKEYNDLVMEEGSKSGVTIHTYQEMLEDVKFGKYIPPQIPEKFIRQECLRIQNEWEDCSVIIFAFVISIENWADGKVEWSSMKWSVSEEPCVGVDGFAAEELTLEKIEEYCHKTKDGKDGAESFQMSFYVDYGDAAVQIYAVDVDPITVYEMLKQI